MKFDELIVAIASVANASTIYSDDAGIARRARPRFTVTGVLELKLPEPDKQGGLFEHGTPTEGDRPPSWGSF